MQRVIPTNCLQTMYSSDGNKKSSEKCLWINYGNSIEIELDWKMRLNATWQWQPTTIIMVNHRSVQRKAKIEEKK